MSLSIDDAKAANEEAQNDQLRDTPAGISEEFQVDWENDEIVDDVKLSPEVLISFSHISNISIEDYGAEENILDLEQNLQGAGPRSYGFDVALTVADPTIEQGEMWVEGDGEYPERKIIGNPDDETNPYKVRYNSDGEQEGLTNLPGGNNFEGEQAELDCDQLTITISGNRAVDVLGALDTAGRWHTTKEGEVAEGLFEVPPNFGTDQYDSEADGYPRMTGYPELRADMDGQRGAILSEFATDDATEADTRTAIDVSVFKITDDGDFVPLASLSPEDEHFYKPQYPRLGNTYWDADSDGDFGADAEPEHNGGVEEAKAVMSSEPTYDDLGSTAQDFVDETLTMVEKMDDPPTESVTETDDWDEYFATNTAGDEIDADRETIETVIDNKL